tara:strand:- start:227 stop:607 length:381 start_codon:yes stop_codon:yes gene_type:complete
VNQNQQGCYAEYLFASTAMRNGFNVSMPLLDASQYDCILEKNGSLYKIQIKYISNTRVKSIYNKYSDQCVLRRGCLTYETKYVDFFAIYKESLKGFFIIKNKKQKTIRLRANGPYKENFNNFALIS